MVEASSTADRLAEQNRLLDLKRYLRELAGTHALPSILTEHLSDKDDSETTFKTTDLLVKDFVARLSGEFSSKDKSLRETRLQLETTRSAQANFEKEKKALEDVIQEKDARMGELSSAEQARQACESRYQDLEERLTSLTAERDAATSELRETQTKLRAAVSEYNEKEIAMQQLGYALEEAQRRNQQIAPPVDTKAMKLTISDLHEELKGVKADKANLERQYERATEAHKQKDDERSKQLEHQDVFVKNLQDKNEKYEEMVQRLRHEKDEQLRKAARAEAERAPTTFRVDNEILTLEEYEKRLDNARGDIADLQERLDQAENDRETVIQEELTVDDVRSMFKDAIVPIYSVAAEEQAFNLFSIWNDEEGGLMSLVGKDGYHEYLRVAVEPDRLPSEASSPGLVGERLNTIDLDSQGSEPASPPAAGQSLKNELEDCSRESSLAPEDIRTGEGDISAKLREELAETQDQRAKARERIEELESETKKQQSDIDRLQGEIRKMEETTVSTEDLSKETEALEKKGRELAGCEAQRVKAYERIEELENEAKKQKNEIDRLQSQIHPLEKIASSNGELSKEAEALKKRVHELAGCEAQNTKARERIEELENEAKKTQNEIGRLQYGIRKLEETVASTGDLGKEAVALRKRVQELEQYIADHEETAKTDKQQLEGASAIEMRNKQAELDECRARREQTDKEIEELKAEAKRREKELKKLKDKFALQQRMDEILKRQIDAAQSKASRAEAKAQWTDARILLQHQSADGEDANSSSIEDNPDQHLELLTNLFNRVNDAEVQLGESHQQVESIQIIVSALRVRIEELEAQQGRLLQEKEQLQDDLKVCADSGQVIGEENIALREELRRKEEKLQEKEVDIEEMSADIRKLKEELKEMEEELKEKQKALDDCHAHGKALMEQVAELERLQGDGTQDDESEDDDDNDNDNDHDHDESQKKITSLEEKIAELETKVKAEAFKAQNEAARRRDVEENGVWKGTSGVALATKQTELDNFKMGHDNIVMMYKKDIKALNKSLSENEAELERTKLEQQQAVDELKARLEASEAESRDHAARLENTKLEHQKATDELRNRLKAAEGKKCNHVDTDLEEVKRGHQLIVDDLQAKLEASEGKSRENDANSERIKIEHEQAIKELEARLAVSNGKRCNHVDTDLEQVKREHQQAMDGLQSRLEAAEKDSLTNHAELERIRAERQQTVEGLESRLEAAENTRRSHDAEVEKIKLEHQQSESDLQSKLEAEKNNSRTKDDELERAKVKHKLAMDELEARLKAADARNQGRDDSALYEIKLEHQRALDDLESRHEATENSSRIDHDTELERIKTEHQKAMDELKAKLSALEDVRDALKDPCKDAQSTADTTPTDAATQKEETAMPTNVYQFRPRPRGAHLDATNMVPFSTRPPQRMIDTALLSQRRELMMLETLHRRLYEQLLSSGAPKTSEAGTAAPPETSPASASDDLAQLSASPDQKLDTSGSDTDNQHAIRLKNIKQSCEAFAEKIRENEEYTKRNDVRSTLHKEILALRQRLRDVEAKQGDGAMDDVDQQQQGADDIGAKDTDKPGNEHREEHDGASEDESDDDDQDPGDDTVAILKRIAKLERKIDKTRKDEHGQEEAVLDLIERMGQGPRHLHGLGGHPCEPFCKRNSIIKKKTVMAQASTIWRRPVPPRPSESDEDDEDYESSSDGDSHGDGERARLSLGEQEALVRSIQAQLVKFFSFAEACDEALDDIYRADEDLMAIPDPVPGGQVRSRSRDRRAMTPAERAAREVEDRNALLRANAYDDPASDASSIASDDDLYSVDGDPNRALKSFIPYTVFNVLKSWKTGTEGLLEGADRIQSDVEALIHAGYNLGRYQSLKRRIRRLRKIVADAAATNAHLRAQLSEGIAASTDDDLREKVRDLRHQNNTLREQLRVTEQSGEIGGAGDKRLGQLRKELMQEKALVNVEQTRYNWLAEEKDELEVIIEKRDETIRKLEASQAKAIQDGLDREMRETLFDNDELKKEVDQLKREVGGLKQRLRDEFMNKTVQVETAQAVVQGMKKRLGDAQRRSDVAEDKRSTLMTDISRALDIDGENDRTRLDKTRRRLSNILCRVEEADEDTGEDKHEGDEGDNKAVDDYKPVSRRERELVREILDERKKRAEHLAEERKRYEGRLGERHAEYEKQVEDWKAMHDAAEKARGLAERNLMDTLDQMEILQKKADWQEGMLTSLDKRLQEQCTITQQLTEELDGTNNPDGEDGEDGLEGDETAGDHEVGGVEVGGGTSAGGQGRGRTPGEEGPRTPRQPHEQPGGAAGGDPGDDDDDDDDDDSSDDSSDGDSDDNNENNNNNPARTPRDRSRCACPCVGLCNDPTNPIFDGLPADAKDVVRDLGRVYKSYRACCGTKRGAAAVPGDDGRLLWRLMGIMRADADVREQIRNADRGYAPRLLLAFRRCLWARLLSWAQAVATVVGGLLHCAASVLPDGRWKPRRPGALPPQRAAIVAQDVLMLCVLYQAWRVVKVSRAAREVWEMANRYTRAYFVERGLHPERSRWFGLDGVDMRLLGTSDDPVMVPLSTAVGDGMGS
ncbi:hypothetical protein CH63R_07593 [Colletotrichum higginsianum IMI 349063]|uniref:Uncharacterized protein n=1 Tax=Colletotrichum higginsianum (strain IMI 349063) TaxID=759273 RepID=A0A1B7YAC8_COLHI|nr:hypothetical protein CH63R_07593 [Colletotrichum higginsianum IMI 349063]OBR08828.1 hypothetical protein CH63R_07593 [Colletotrichum higginsianum IMI 349063]